MKYLTILLLITNLCYGSEILNKKSQLESLTGCKFTVSSGDRSISHNKKVGGAKNSYHIRPGMALDLVKNKSCSLTYYQIGKHARKLFNGVIYYRKHIHVDLRKKPVFFRGRY